MASSAQSIYLKARHSHKIHHPANIGDAYHWSIRILAHDVFISLKFLPKASTNASDPIILLPSTKYEAKDPSGSAYDGSYVAPSNGEFVLKIDNSHSLMRGKNVIVEKDEIISNGNQRLIIPLGSALMTPYGRADIVGVREERNPSQASSSSTPTFSDRVYTVKLSFGTGYVNALTIANWLEDKRLNPDDSKFHKFNANDRATFGAYLFLVNQIETSEQFFKSELNDEVVFSVSHSALSFLRGIMTWDKADLEIANQNLKQTQTFAAKFLPSESIMSAAVSSISRVVTFGRASNTSSGLCADMQQLECTLISAETFLLQALLLLLTEESYIAYINAGLKIRSAYKNYEKCLSTLKYWKKSDPAQYKNVDPHIEYGIKFGLGSFNTMISTLPPTLLKIVSFLGFPASRSVGLTYLYQSFHSNTLRSCLAGLSLVFLHTIIPSFCTIFDIEHAKESQQLIDQCLVAFPNGALFLWLQGRLFRNKKDLPGALQAFTKAQQANMDWKQLQHLTAYEIAWCHVFMNNPELSLPYWRQLEEENNWSKVFCTYMQGVCQLETLSRMTLNESDSSSKQEKLELMKKYFAQIENAPQRKIGGRVIAIEAFVYSRSQGFSKRLSENLSLKSQDPNSISLEDIPNAAPYIEIIYIFHGFSQMSPLLIANYLQRVQKELEIRKLADFDAIIASNNGSAYENTKVSAMGSHFFLLHLLRATMEKILGNVTLARTILGGLAKREKSIDNSPDKWMIAFARFELAVLEFEGFAIELRKRLSENNISTTTPITLTNEEDQRLTEIRELFRKAEEYGGDYHFKNRLHLRIHLAVSEIKRIKKGEFGVLPLRIQSDDESEDLLEKQQLQWEMAHPDQQADTGDTTNAVSE